MIQDIRNLEHNTHYNQHTIHENETLETPGLALSGKIAQRHKSIGKFQGVDYMFLFVLTDLKNGRVLWDNEEIISKAIDRDMAPLYDDGSSLSIATSFSAQNTEEEQVSSNKPSMLKVKYVQRHGGYADTEVCPDKGYQFYTNEDFTQALTNYTKVCDMGNASSCYNLGAFYDDGEGVKRSDLKAKSFIAKPAIWGAIRL